MDQKYKTRYLGGMDKDTAPTRYGDTTYYHAENLRLTPNTDHTGTILSNIESDRLKISNYDTIGITNAYHLIGDIYVDKYLIQFFTSQIGAPYSGNHTDYICAYDPTVAIDGVNTLVCSGIFGFSTYYPITAVSNYDGTNYKVYWADGYNSIRAFTATIITGVFTIDTTNLPSDFDLLPSTSFSTPTLTGITNGHLNTGMYQYSYQLYKLYRGESLYAPVSSLIHITQSSDFLNAERYFGSNVGVVTGKGINGQFTNPTAGFNRVRIVALQYETLNQNPLIRIVVDKPIVGKANEIISFYDDGDSIGTISIEEFQLINGAAIISQTLAVKNNILFAGNVQSTPFQPVFDAKAYRYNANGNAYIWSTDGTKCYKSDINSVSSFSYYEIGIAGIAWDYSLTNWNLTIPSDPPGLISTTVTSIPDDFDCFNLHNDIQKDSQDTDVVDSTHGRNKFLTNGWSGGIPPDTINSSLGTNSHNYAGAGTLRWTSTFDKLAITGTHVSGNVYTIQTTGQYQVQLSGVTISVFLDTTVPGNSITNWNSQVTISVHAYIIWNNGVIPIANLYQSNVAGSLNNYLSYTIPTIAAPQQLMTAGDTLYAGIVVDIGVNTGYLQTTINCGLSYLAQPVLTNLIAGGSSTQGTVLGGEGPNIQYTFSANSTITNLYSFNNPILTSPLGSFSTNPSYLTFASPYLDMNKMYQWDEIYRFAIEFVDVKGRPSPAYWIGDIRFPSHAIAAITWGAIHQNTGAVQTTLLPNINFKVQNVPTSAVGWRIMRVKRDQIDRTVIMEGALIPTAEVGSTLGNYFNRVTYTQPVGRGDFPSTDIYSKDLFNFVSPEVNYNKDLSWESSDLVSIHAKYTISSSSYPDVSTLGGGSYSDRMRYGNFDHTVSFTTSTYPFEFAVISSAMVQSPAVNDSLATSIGSYTYRNFCFLNPNDNSSLKGPCGSNYTILLNTLLDPTTSSLPIDDNSYSIYHAVYKRPNLGAYGGYSYAARLNNIYQPCSDYINNTNTTYYTNSSYVARPLIVYGGDVVSSIFNKLWCIYSTDLPEDQRQGTILSFPVISSINLYLSNGSTPDRLANAGQPAFWGMGETQGAYNLGGSPVVIFFQTTDMYIYNSVFSQESTTQTQISVTNITPLTNFYNRVYYSDTKISGELIDSWTIFRPGNFKEVNGMYGDINVLLNFKNTLIFFQERAVGVLSVQERSAIADNNLGMLVIGTGGILDRYDYYTTETGTYTEGMVVKSDKTIYWYDPKRREIFSLTNGEMKHLSRDGKIQSWLNADASYLNTIPVLNTVYYPVTCIFDRKYREVLFSFSGYQGMNTSKTLVFSQEEEKFTACYTLTSRDHFLEDKFGDYYYVNTGNSYLSLYRRNDAGLNAIGMFFCNLGGSQVTCKLSTIINPYGTIPCRFDVLEIATILKNTSLIEQQSTWTSLVVSNSYQNSGVITLIPGTNIIRRYRTWRFNNFRDTQPDNPRFKDNYLQVDFVLDNTKTSGAFLVEDLLTDFFMLSPK